MDLRSKRLTPEQIEQVEDYIIQGKLAYQPFIFTDTLETGPGEKFHDGETKGGRVYWEDAPEDLSPTIKEILTDDPAHFRECNGVVRYIYNYFIDSITGALGDISGLSFAEVGCNTGFFLHSLGVRGAGRCIGIDYTRNEEVFKWFNNVLGLNSEFRFGEWNALKHRLLYTKMPKVDVTLTIAVMCHIADPLYHLSYLCDHSAKAVFVYTPVNKDTGLSVSYGAPAKYPNSLSWPLGFDNAVRPSVPLLRMGLQEAGFEDIREIKCPEGLSQRWQDWYCSQIGLLAFRTRDVRTALGGGRKKRGKNPVSKPLHRKKARGAGGKTARPTEGIAQSGSKQFFDFNGELKLPAVVEIEPTNYCNLRCRMCHVSHQRPVEPRHIELEALRELQSPEGMLVVLGSNFEPMMHPDFAEMISILDGFGVRLDIITNGTLLNDKNIEAITNANFSRIGFSFDGIRKETYEHIRRNANFERTIENILRLREAFECRDTLFTVNNVLMRCNIDELTESIDFWDSAGFHRLNFPFMMSRAKDEWISQQSLFSIRDHTCARLDEAAKHLIECGRKPVLGCPYYSRSPLQEIYPHNFSEGNVFSDNVAKIRALKQDKIELQRGEFPGMKFKGCRSAFTFARILSNGDVQLCYKQIVGNIYSDGFEEIWFGQRAHGFRRQLMEGTDICSNCACWLFCLNQQELDINYSSTFLGGIFRERLLVEEGYKGFNIISFHGDLYGLAQSEERLDIEKFGTEGYRCVTGDSVEDVKDKIDALCTATNLNSVKVLEIDLTNYCNLRCRICHAGVRPTPKDRLVRFDPLWVENIDGIGDCLVKLGATYEPAIHPHFVEIVKSLSDRGCEIELITNATNIDEGVAAELSQCNLSYVTFSLDSVDKATYEEIRRGADFDVVKENIVGLRRAMKDRPTYFRINVVLMRSNIGQLQYIIDFAEANGIDLVSFIVMELRDLEDRELARQSLYPIRDILVEKLDEAAEYVLRNSMKPAVESLHYYGTALRDKYPDNFEGNVIVSDNPQSRFVPYRRNTLQLGRHPDLDGDCISPFTYAYVYPTGQVELCRMFSIGDVSESSFTDIWEGVEADAVRKGIIANQRICDVCPYYKSCLAPGSSPEILNLDNPFNYVDRNITREGGNANTSGSNIVISELFKSATIEESDEPKTYPDPLGDTLVLEDLKSVIQPESVKPRLLEEGYKGYNILRLRSTIYGLAQSEGKLDTNKIGVEGYRCFVADSVEEAKRLIDGVAPHTEREDRRLIEEGYKGYNIIALGDSFYGLAQCEGRLDVDMVGTEGYRCVVGGSVGDIKLLIDEAVSLRNANPTSKIEAD